MGNWSDRSTANGTGEATLDRSEELSFRNLVDRRSQIADAYLSATYRPADTGTNTDPKSTRIEEIDVAEREISSSAIARVAVSQRLPARANVKDVKITERWIGRVVDVEGGVFSAELRPLDGSGPVVVGDLQVDKVDAANRDLVEVGAPFYLVVGHIPLTATSQLGVQHLLFTRVGRWRTSDLDELREQGNALFHSIEVDDPE